MPEFDSTTEYRPIPNYPGYFAGSDGSIWTTKRCSTKLTKNNYQKWARIKHKIDKTGYLRLSLSKENKRVTVSVHKLVLESFVGPCPEGYQCRHLDGDPTNCKLDNLVWGTVQENHDDKKRHGTMARGSSIGCSKLTEDQVVEIRKLAREGVFLKEIARRFSVADISIARIVRRKTWGHLSDNKEIPDISRVTGTKHPNSKITPEIVREIRKMNSQNDSQQTIADKFKISQTTVWAILHNKTWSHVKD
jgi:hypothetical protein